MKNVNSKWKKCVSALLVLIMILQIVPLQIYAEEIKERELDESTASVWSESTTNDNTTSIVGEMDEKREEDVKQFLNDDGSYTAVKYFEPIHYKDTSGNWININNTLKLSSSEIDGKKVITFVPTDSPLDIKFKQELDNEGAVIYSSQGHQITWSIISDSNDLEAADTDKDSISPNMVENNTSENNPESIENNGETDVNTEGNVEITNVDENADAEVSYEEENKVDIIDTNEYSADEDLHTGDNNAENIGVEENIIAENSSTAFDQNGSAIVDQGSFSGSEKTVITENQKDNTKEKIEEIIEQSKKSPITAEKIERSVIFKNDNEQYTSLDGLSDGLRYNNVLPNVDLEYILDSVYFKENIVLKDKNAPSSYVMNYTLGDLKAVQINEQQIDLIDSLGKTIFTIVAPYMSDAEGNFCDKLAIRIISQENGICKIEITADQEWLQADNRVYPVKIDPYINETVRNFDHDASALYIRNTYPYGTLCVGNDQGAYYGKMKSYVQFSLPTLSSGDVVTGGYLNLAKYAGTAGYTHVEEPNLQVNVYKVLSSWNENSVKSSSGYSGLPSIDTKVIDYQKVSAQSQAEWITFDVSKAAKAWYDGESNYGLCLMADDPNAWAIAKFIASDNTDYVGARPTLQITYRNNKGLENYWTTHDQSLGNSGCGYVNDYTGNLVFAAPICSSNGNIMPVSLNLIYNGYQYNTNVDRANKFGYGWRLNVQEKIIPIVSGSSTLHTKLYDNGFRYIYEDSDGTSHYFKVDSSNTSKYIDEDGIGLTLTVNSTVTDLEKYVVTADTGGKMTFTAAGNLRKVYDDNGNFYKIIYSDTVAGLITEVHDGVQRRFIISSNSAGRVTSIKDPTGQYTTFTYRDWGGLYKITYPDGTETIFYYYDNCRLKTVCARNGNKVCYTYPTTGDAAAKSRVIGISEYNRNDDGSCSSANVGNSISVDYSSMNYTKFTDNRVLSDSSRRSEIYQFDNYGRTMGTIDADGNIGKYGYTSDSSANANPKKTNTLTKAAVSTKYVNNLLLNHSFENGYTNWYNSGTTIDTTTSYLGSKSIKAGSNSSVSQLYTPTSGTLYTFSSYVKTDSADTKACLQAYFYDANGSYLSYATSNSIDYQTDWERNFVTFTMPAGATSFRVYCKVSGTGHAWFDCVQLENYGVMNPYNMVENGGLSSTASTAWSAINTNGDDGYYSNSDRGRYYYMAGDGSSDKRLVQKIYINRPANKTYFSVSAYSYGNSVPLTSDSRRYAVGICMHLSNGEEKYFYAPFNPDYSAGWQYTSGVFGENDSHTIEYIYVRCLYYGNENAARFDNIQVTLDETGTAYTYDDNGNLISAKDNAGRNQTFSYNNANEVTQATTADNKNYTYTYSTSNKHQLLSATSQSSNVKFKYDYDSYGNVTSSTVQKADGSGKYIKQYTTYTSNGNYVDKAYSDRGYATTYNYGSTNGKLYQVTDPNGNSTYYDYYANSDRLYAVSDRDNSNDAAASTVGYSYDSKGYLTSITSPSTTYNFTYDAFGNNTKIKAGNNTLITNSYQSNNGHLNQSTYGNGFVVGYSYDKLDRVTGKSYNGSTKYTWRYNANGQVGYHKDYVSGKAYNYTYDNIGRLIRTDVSDGSWIRSNYNTVDKSTSSHYKFANNGNRDVYYGYSSRDNLPASTRFGTNSANQVSYDYDSIGRMSNTTYAITQNTNAVAKTAYKYHDWETSTPEGRTTSTIEGIDFTYVTGGLSVPDLYYNYDANGNITAERTWQPSASNPIREKYTYDSKNQLIRHDSATKNKSYTYTYDKAGNILTRKEYAYTTGTLGTATGTTNYTYGNSSWGDLLTSYNGNTITYDAIGNMTSYNGNTYTWQGRQLNQMRNSSHTYQYTYDSNGIRTSKTVDGTTTEYFLDGNQILAQKTGDNTIWFFYDSEGNRIGMIRNGYTFYYLYNLQGDVIGLMDARNGTIIATYSYDAWGNCTVQNASGWTAGNANPFRYRGYYYDNESGLYYLNSRYYSPELGRFINADKAISGTGKSVQGYNLFAYCFNNPTNANDSTGNWPKWAEKAAKAVAVAAVVVTAVVVVSVVTAGTGGLALAAAGVAFGTACGGLVGGIANEKKGESFINGWLGGAANGLTQSLGTATLGPAGTIAGGGVGSGLGTAITESLNNKGKTIEQRKTSNAILKDSLKSTAIGTIMSTMTAGIGYGIDYAQSPLGYNSWAGSLSPGAGIAPMTPGFGEMMKGFFGSVDDALVYVFCD